MRMSKPWAELTKAEIIELPAQLGVCQIGDFDGSVCRIGYAGGKQPFGMRSALSEELASRIRRIGQGRSEVQRLIMARETLAGTFK